MSKSFVRKPMRVPVTGWPRLAIDALAMLIYITLVYVWGLWVYPLGRDYAFLAQPGAGMPFLAAGLFRWEVAAWGAWPVGYHLVNLALLYACMACLYTFVRLTVEGPFWLGTLAATLFMANPVHTESALNLCGVVDLVPCLAALAALAVYAADIRQPKIVFKVLAPLLFAWAMLPYQDNAFLLIVLILLECFHARSHVQPRNNHQEWMSRLVPAAVLTLVAWFGHRAIFTWSNLDPAAMFEPLYFIFYPLGFLPETARRFHAQPWLGWVAVLTTILVILLIYRKARRPLILFSLLSMLAVRLFQGGHTVDAVHLVGGGQLLLANALFTVAVVVLSWRIMDHRKWVHPIILLTTWWCLAFFVIEIHSIMMWRHAGAVVRQFQSEAQRAARPLGILPDFQYYEGAPMCLSESIARDTLFSPAVPALSLLPLNYQPPPKLEVRIDHWSADAGRVRITARAPRDLLCYPYTLESPHAVLKTLDSSPGQLLLEIKPTHGPLPATLLPNSGS